MATPSNKKQPPRKPRKLTDRTAVIAQLKKQIRDFVRERDWEQFHNPKDLGIALTIETAEILDHFRFLKDPEIAEQMADPRNKRELSHELADAFYFLLRLADVLDIDVATAMSEKLRLLEQKYPADVVRGKPYKYTHYLKE